MKWFRFTKTDAKLAALDQRLDELRWLNTHVHDDGEHTHELDAYAAEGHIHEVQAHEHPPYVGVSPTSLPRSAEPVHQDILCDCGEITEMDMRFHSHTRCQAGHEICNYLERYHG